MLRSINPCHELSLIDPRIYLLARALRNSSLSFSVRSSSQCASSFPFSIPPSSPSLYRRWKRRKFRLDDITRRGRNERRIERFWSLGENVSWIRVIFLVRGLRGVDWKVREASCGILSNTWSEFYERSDVSWPAVMQLARSMRGCAITRVENW